MPQQLVFVSVKDGPTLPSGRPLRKAVVPLAPGVTWADFRATAARKLRVSAVGAVYQAKTLTEVTSIEQLGEIDELVVEVPGGVSAPGVAPAAPTATPPRRAAQTHTANGSGAGGGGNAAPFGAMASAALSPPSVQKQRSGNSSNSHASTHAAAAAAIAEADAAAGGGNASDGADDKYSKRTPWHVRAMRKAGVGGAARSLPLTVGDTKPGGGGALRKKRTKSRSSGFQTVAAIAMLSCFATIYVLYSRLQLQDDTIDSEP